jgi:hypothetical protein
MQTMTPRRSNGTMFSSLDTIASANPATSATAIYSFLVGYVQEFDEGADIALAFLPVPIALSEDLSATFEGTSVATGLLVWLNRHPGLRIELLDYLRDAIEISRRGVLFGLQRNVFTLGVNGKLLPRTAGLNREPKDPVGLGISERPITVAKRFGHWCGAMRSTKAVFISLGVRP